MKHVDIKELKRKLPKLEEIITGKSKKKGKYLVFHDCPFCNHKDHFVIDLNKNEYHSFNGCCDRGSVIDWYMKKEGMSWKDIFQMVSEPIPKVDKEAKNREKIREEKINNLFNLLYDNLIWNYKRLLKIKDKNDFGIWYFNFCDFWSTEFAKSENKEEIIKTYKADIRTELNYMLSSM